MKYSSRLTEGPVVRVVSHFRLVSLVFVGVVLSFCCNLGLTLLFLVVLLGLLSREIPEKKSGVGNMKHIQTGVFQPLVDTMVIK